MNFEQTLGNFTWMRENEEALKKLLPETWTHVRNLSGLQLAFQFKLLGIDWRSNEEFAKVMLYFERICIMQRSDMNVRRNPNRVFPHVEKHGSAPP